MKNDKVNEILEYLKNELKYNNCNIDTKEKGWEQYNGLDDDLLHYIRKIEKENKRLNNIINELEKEISKHIALCTDITLNDVLDILKELKGSDKE